MRCWPARTAELTRSESCYLQVIQIPGSPYCISGPYGLGFTLSVHSAVNKKHFSPVPCSQGWWLRSGGRSSCSLQMGRAFWSDVRHRRAVGVLRVAAGISLAGKSSKKRGGSV